jgi:hypothetical protein
MSLLGSVACNWWMDRIFFTMAILDISFLEVCYATDAQTVAKLMSVTFLI